MNFENYFYAYGNEAFGNNAIEALLKIKDSNNYNNETGTKDGIYYIDIETGTICFCTKISQMGQLILQSPESHEVIYESKNLPNNWDEYCTFHDGSSTLVMKSAFDKISEDMDAWEMQSNQNFKNAYISFIKLMYIRDDYRGEWVPNINNKEDKMCAIFFNENVMVNRIVAQSFNYPLSFENKDVAEKFSIIYNDMIWEARYLLGYNDYVAPNYTVFNRNTVNCDITIENINDGKDIKDIEDNTRIDPNINYRITLDYDIEQYKIDHLTINKEEINVDGPGVVGEFITPDGGINFINIEAVVVPYDYYDVVFSVEDCNMKVVDGNTGTMDITLPMKEGTQFAIKLESYDKENILLQYVYVNSNKYNIDFDKQTTVKITAKGENPIFNIVGVPIPISK